MRKTVANKLNREWASSNVRAHAVTQYYDAAQIGFTQILKDKGFTLPEIGTHAGLNDTSLMLALDPSLVRQDRLVHGSRFGPDDGVYGDPSRASAELGTLGVDAIVASNRRRDKVRRIATMTRGVCVNFSEPSEYGRHLDRHDRSASAGLDRQLKPKRARRFRDRVEGRVPPGNKSLVDRLPAQPRSP